MAKLLFGGSSADLEKDGKLKELLHMAKRIMAISKLECQHCAMAKARKLPFAAKANDEPDPEIGYRLHADVTGKILLKLRENGGLEEIEDEDMIYYYSIVVEGKSGKVWGKALRHKSEAAEHVMEVARTIQNKTGRWPRFFRSDGGGEYEAGRLQEFLASRGITHERTTRDTPQHNGKAERKFQTLFNLGRANMIKCGLPSPFWPFSVDSAVFVSDRCLVRSDTGKTPDCEYEGRPMSIHYLRVFGCDVVFRLADDEMKDKISPRGNKGVMLGYGQREGYYKVLDIERKMLKIVRDVEFFEDSFNNARSAAVREMAGLEAFRWYGELPDIELEIQDEEGDNPLQLRPVVHERLEEAGRHERELRRWMEEEKNSGQPVASNYSNNESDRLLFLTNYIKQDYGRAAFDIKRQFRSKLGIIGDKLKWAAISKDEQKFRLAFQFFYPDVPYSVQFPEAAGDRVRLRARRYGAVDYESQELMHDGENLFNARNPHLQMAFVLVLANLVDPMSWQQAMESSNKLVWLIAARKEYTSLDSMGCFELSDLPSGRRAIPCRWVFKTKYGANGEVIKHKARLVIKGFYQKHGVDYDETYAPVMKYTSLRVLLALAAIYDWEIRQFDVVSAFLNADLKEEVYMEQPEGFEVEGQKHKVLKLRKALYGLKQAPHEWNGDIDSFLASIGFVRCSSDSCLYYWEDSNGKRIYIGLFVDDVIILFANEMEEKWNKIKRQIEGKYKIDDIGEAAYILGMRITRNRAERTLCLDQQTYIEKVAARFNLSESSAESPNTTMAVLFGTKENEVKLSGAQQKVHQQLTGSALYSAMSTRPDIANAVMLVSRFNVQANPTQERAARKIIKYLNGTKSMRLKFDGKLNGEVQNEKQLPHMIAFADSDWGGDPIELKSTTGFVIKLNNCPVHWISKRQSTISKSSCEAEIVAMGSCVKELIWMRNLLSELKAGTQTSGCTVELYSDNQAATRIVQTDIANSRTKHIAMNYSFVRHFIRSGGVQVKWISTKEQQADFLTKPKGPTDFQRIRSKIMEE